MKHVKLHKIFWTFVLGCLCAPLTAQIVDGAGPSLLNNELQIRQCAETEHRLTQWLRPLSAGQDTLYALLFQPAGCPRCESAAQEFEKAFRQALPSERLVLWCAHGDAEAARRYARREGLRADTLVVDTAGVWRRVFSLNHEELNGIFLLKMAVGSGRMLTGGELSYVDDDLFRELALSRLPLPFHSYGDDAVGADRASIAEVPGGGPLRYERWPLLTEGQAVLSWLREPPVLRNGRLLVNDNLENAGFMFRLDPAARAFRLEHVLRVDTAVRDTFVDLPPRIYDQVHRQFRYMVCGLSFVNDDTVAFSYSLPRVFVERRTGDNVNLAFYNEPVILSWQVEPFRTLPLTDLAAALQDAAYMNQHFAIYPYDGQHVAMACQQLTYPLFSVPDSLHGHPEYDPFVEAYYDRPHPYAVVVDWRTGAFVRRIGQLDDLMRRSRTGYGYASPVADSDGRQLVYGNAYAGRLYLASPEAPDSVLRTYDVFGWAGREMPEPDTTLFYTHEYLLRYSDFFNRRIVQVQLAEQFVDCLYREKTQTSGYAAHDVYEYVRFDRETGEEVTRYVLRPQDEAESVLGYGLERGGRPFYVGKQHGQTYVKFVEPVV